MMGEGGTAALSAAAIRDLRRLAGIMVPADEAYGVPGADDPSILDDLLRSLGPDTAGIRAALAALSALAGGGFGEMSDADAEAVGMRLLAAGGENAAVLGRLVLAAYYRDDRVVRALGREARPPFPLGHDLPDEGWALLDPVRTRAPLWRDDRRG